MIGYLEGSILRIQNDRCWIYVGGVGYIVSVGTRLAASSCVSGVLKVWIESVVHDGQEHLFGFAEPEEQTWFQWLIAVSGVGGRVAMHLLSAFTPNVLAGIVCGGDVAALRGVDGVGPKLANRLITELKDKGSTWGATHPGFSAGDPTGYGDLSADFLGIHKDALLALVALGYRRLDAEQAVAKISADHAVESVGQMITLCLPVLSGR